MPGSGATLEVIDGDDLARAVRRHCVGHWKFFTVLVAAALTLVGGGWAVLESHAATEKAARAVDVQAVESDIAASETRAKLRQEASNQRLEDFMRAIDTRLGDVNENLKTLIHR